MSQGRGQYDSRWDMSSVPMVYTQRPPPSNTFSDMASYPPPQTPLSSTFPRGRRGMPNERIYDRRSLPPDPSQINSKPNHSSLPGHYRQPLSPSSDQSIDDLQSRIRNMLTDSSPEPGITSPAIRSPVHPRGTLYHPPSLRGRHHHPHSHSHSHSQSGAQDFRQRDTCADITAYALNIVKSLEIPTDELLEKEEFCRDLEQIIKRLRPSSNLELFGSFANTFTIANSDIDCCVTDPIVTSDELQQSGLPEALQKELDSLGFETTLLTLTRIPILKIFRPATDLTQSTLPEKIYKYPLNCDVGWQNRLALHNTRLLATYSRLDARLRQIALFIKYWTKTRGIARPRYGTLCSYGYVLMIIYYLTHVVVPPVLPNLQNIPDRGITRLEDLECEGCNIYFSKDGNGWKTKNTDSIGELIKGFFNYFAFEWHFKNNVISIRSPTGILTKESKGWTTLAESTGSLSQTIRSRYLIAIEDPFEISHNVARTVNQQGRFEIRGEFIRAAKMLNVTGGRQQWLGDVCVERVLSERVSRPRKEEENGQTREEVEENSDEEGKARVVIPSMEMLQKELVDESGNGKVEIELVDM